MAELKFCPFCGKNNSHVKETAYGNYENIFYYVVCDDCGCRTKSVRDPNEAVELWNERAGSVVSAHWEYAGESDGKKIYRCTNCQAVLPGTGNFCKECGARMDEEVE